MSDPINPQLYKALQRAFGDVHIGNEGDLYIPVPVPTTFQGRRSSPPAHAGEYYCVACPFCHDSRKHLWINHMWGVQTEDKDDHLYLACCYRCEGIATRVDQKELHEKVFPFAYGRRVPLSELVPADRSSPTEDHASLAPVTTPVGLFSFQDTLAARAAAYLHERGFDPAALERQWGVQYCVYAPNVQPKIYDRIVIPIFTLLPTLQIGKPNEIVLAGWQSRHIGDSVPQGQGKYMSMQGMKKSHLLYGLHQAVDTTGLVVIVEGVTDVWRLGSHAVAVLGKSVSRTQQQLLVRHFPGRPIVVFFDDGTTTEGRLAATAIRAIRAEYGDRSPVVVATPPAGRADVGACSCMEAWAAVRAALPAQDPQLPIETGASPWRGDHGP